MLDQFLVMVVDGEVQADIGRDAQHLTAGPGLYACIPIHLIPEVFSNVEPLAIRSAALLSSEVPTRTNAAVSRSTKASVVMHCPSVISVSPLVDSFQVSASPI